MKLYEIYVTEPGAASVGAQYPEGEVCPTEGAWYGKRIREDGLVIINYNKKGKFYDWTPGVSWAPYVKTHVKERLSPKLGQLVQWIGPFLVDGHELYLLNCLNIIDCLKEGSKHSWFYVIPEKVKDQAIFRPERFLKSVLVAEWLKDEIESAGDTGIRFGKIGEDGWIEHPFGSKATPPVWKLNELKTCPPVQRQPRKSRTDGSTSGARVDADLDKAIQGLLNKLKKEGLPEPKPASAENLKRAQDAGFFPTELLYFYLACEPMHAIELNVRICSINKTIEENTIYVPGCALSPHGYIVFASTLTGDSYCIDTNVTTQDGKHPVVLFSHEMIREDADLEEINPLRKEVAASLTDFLVKFTNETLSEEPLYE